MYNVQYPVLIAQCVMCSVQCVVYNVEHSSLAVRTRSVGVPEGISVSVSLYLCISVDAGRYRDTMRAGGMRELLHTEI